MQKIVQCHHLCIIFKGTIPPFFWDGHFAEEAERHLCLMQLLYDLSKDDSCVGTSINVFSAAVNVFIAMQYYVNVGSRCSFMIAHNDFGWKLGTVEHSRELSAIVFVGYLHLVFFLSLINDKMGAQCCQ